MLDKAFDALKSYDWGVEPNVLSPIEEAIVNTHGDAEARRQLEVRLAAVLGTDAPYDAKDYACRKLRMIGTADCVPVLANLLLDEQLSHMARYALESIPAAEAAQALRAALPKLKDGQQVGAISSLGVRQDATSVPLLLGLLSDGNRIVAKAAAHALGAIRSPEAAAALETVDPADADCKLAVTDALLACAESLLRAGNKMDALAIYKRLAKGDQPKHVRLAATRGMLACAGKTD